MITSGRPDGIQSGKKNRTIKWPKNDGSAIRAFEICEKTTYEHLETHYDRIGKRKKTRGRSPGVTHTHTHKPRR